MKKLLLIILIFMLSANTAFAGRTPRIIQNLSELVNRAISDTTGTLSVLRGGTGTTTMVSGGIMFTDGTTLKQDSVNFFWDDTNNKFGIASSTPSSPLSIKADASENAISIQDNSGADFWNIDTLLDNLTFSRNGTKRVEIDGTIGYLRSNFFSSLDGTNIIDMLSGPDITFFTDNNKNQLQMGASGTVFNNSADVALDFRIAANAGAGANAFVVDSSVGNVSVGDLTPQAKFEVAGPDNALGGVGLSGNYLQILRHVNNTTGNGAGLGFAITSTDNNIGAAIIAKRTGGNSQAELQFYTKQSATGGVAPVQAMVISATGRLGVGTTTPATLLDIFSTATSTITLDTNSATQGACLKMRDIDGAGYSYGTALNGAITWSQISCE